MSEWEAAGKSDDWYTPKFIFDAMSVVFDIDVAAPPEGPRHVPCADYLWRDGLTAPWRGFAWMNPPFGARNGVRPWLRRFVSHGCGVALIPDRTSAPRFQEAAPRAELLLFLSPKVKFERPDGSIGASPGSGTVLMAIGAAGCAALRNASRLGWLAHGVAP